MSELIHEMGPYWEVVTDLVLFFHNYCYNCMPYEGGEPVWICDQFEIEDAVSEIVSGVCDVHGLQLDTEITDEVIRRAILDSNLRCPNCGTEWQPFIEIGDQWVFEEGKDARGAVHLLTRKYWPFLTHYTKGTGARADQSVLDAILQEGILRASSLFITGGHKVVCLTECSPPEIMEMLRVQGESSRAEPEQFRWRRSMYGIAIDRTAAVREGALPVIHGDLELRAALPSSKQHLFVRFEHGGRYSDWTFEREFRFLGDVSLDRFGPDELLVIVPTRRDRFHVLAQLKVPPWPVVPLDYFLTEDHPHASLTGRQKRLAFQGM